MEIVIQENSKYGLVVSSRVIAKELGKEHSKVLRTLDEILEKPNMASLIIPSFYRTQGQKREYKEYLLTKDGFILYMFNIRGYQDFKLAYIDKFNKMEKVLKNKEMLSLKKQIALFDKKQFEAEEYKDRVKILIKNYEEIYRAINLIYEETEAMRLAVSESNKKLNTIYFKVGVELRESKAMLEKLELF